MKILLVEDEPSIVENLSTFLKDENFLVETAMVYDLALEKLSLYHYDCVLLDLMIPGGDGLDLLKVICASANRVPVIITSARGNVTDRIVGLDAGADDYLPKPFDLMELLSRIKSAIRRSTQHVDPLIRFRNLVLDPEQRAAFIDEKPMALNRKEYEILYYFLLRPNKMIQKSLLAESIWGDSVDQVDSYDFIYSQVKNLRKKLKDHGAEVDLKSVYGVGYKLI